MNYYIRLRVIDWKDAIAMLKLTKLKVKACFLWAMTIDNYLFYFFKQTYLV